MAFFKLVVDTTLTQFLLMCSVLSMARFVVVVVVAVVVVAVVVVVVVVDDT